MVAPLTLGKGLTIGKGITFGAGTGGGGGGSLILSLLGSVGPVGTTIVDQSGNYDNFNWNGSNPWDSVNNLYDFTNATATANSTTLFDAITNQITIFAWVKFPNGFSGNLAIIARNPSFALRIDNGNSINLVKYNHADQNVSYTFNDTNKWYHICAIQSPTQVTYVINGSVIGTYTNSDSFYTTADPIFIGYDDYTGEYAPIQISTLDVWNTAQSVADAQSAWNSQKSSYGYGAPIASTYSVGVNGNVTDYSLSLSSYITGSYSSVNITSSFGSGSARVSGTDILYTGTPAQGYHTLTITYTVTGTYGTSSPATITVQNGTCCVVATTLTNQGLWTPRQYKALNIWGVEVLDKSFAGRALHKGYHVIAPKVIVPALNDKGTLKAKYFKWSFDNATKMLRGKKYNKLSIVNSALWITAMTITGLFTTQKQAEKSWQSIYKDKE